MVHEQNSVAGLTNRALRPLATRTLEAFGGALGRGAETVGNPVREAIASLPAPQVRLAGREGPARLLVLGGSQGARVLNRTVPAALARLPETLAVEVRHQTGERTREEAEAAYADAVLGPRVTVHREAFIEDMAGAYGWADLVLCRAGALTVAELAAAGVASVLVPLPGAVDDHQTGNAAHLTDRGAGVLLPEREMSPARLATTLGALLSDPETRLRMAVAAHRAAEPDSARRVADRCLELYRSAVGEGMS